MLKGWSNNSDGFHNPYTVGIWVGGCFRADELVRIISILKSVHFKTELFSHVITPVLFFWNNPKQDMLKGWSNNSDGFHNPLKGSTINDLGGARRKTQKGKFFSPRLSP